MCAYAFCECIESKKERKKKERETHTKIDREKERDPRPGYQHFIQQTTSLLKCMDKPGRGIYLR